MRYIIKHFHLLKGAKTQCSTIFTGSPERTPRCNRPAGKAGPLPGCKLKDMVRMVARAHMDLSALDMDIIMVMAGADHGALSDGASVSLALARVMAGVSPMNSSPCGPRPQKAAAFSLLPA